MDRINADFREEIWKFFNSLRVIHLRFLDCFPDGIAEKAENEISELKA
jgi:hypothetical protein